MATGTGAGSLIYFERRAGDEHWVNFLNEGETEGWALNNYMDGLVGNPIWRD